MTRRKRKLARHAVWQPGQPVVITFADGSTHRYRAGQPDPVAMAVYQQWRKAQEAKHVKNTPQEN